MKTFVDGRMAIVLSCVFILLHANGTAGAGDGSFEVETSRKTNLRRSLQVQQEKLGDVHPISATNRRSMQEGKKNKNKEATEETFEFEASETETEELENIEKEFDGGNDETEELEQIEEEFDGGNSGEAVSPEEIANAETEEAEEVEETEEEEAEEETAITKAPTVAPTRKTAMPVTVTQKPTITPYTSGDDEFDPVKAADEKHAEEEEVQELEAELKQEEKVAQRAGGLGIFFGILAMIFTAQQMSENPDGIYASVCRLAITISSVVVKIICMPCRKVMGVGGNGNPYSGHMPISTSDYNFRNDPYRSNANAGFEMS